MAVGTWGALRSKRAEALHGRPSLLLQLNEFLLHLCSSSTVPSDRDRDRDRGEVDRDHQPVMIFAGAELDATRARILRK
jgi:hypothetical protein